jgi:hypothetical protein
MSEKVYKISIEIESTDVVDAVEAIRDLYEKLEDIDIQKISYLRSSDDVTEWSATFKTEERCEHCHGDGEVATDEDDGEGHTMRGVGSQKCICQQ